MIVRIQKGCDGTYHAPRSKQLTPSAAASTLATDFLRRTEHTTLWKERSNFSDRKHSHIKMDWCSTHMDGLTNVTVRLDACIRSIGFGQECQHTDKKPSLDHHHHWPFMLIWRVLCLTWCQQNHSPSRVILFAASRNLTTILTSWYCMGAQHALKYLSSLQGSVLWDNLKHTDIRGL